MLYPCKNCSAKCPGRDACHELSAYKKSRKENIKKNKEWARESVALKKGASCQKHKNNANIPSKERKQDT